MIVIGGWPGRQVIGLNGHFGVRPGALATGGDFPSPLQDDADSGDALAELVAVVTSLPSSGVVQFDDDGGFSHTDAVDGTYATGFDLYAWAPGGPVIKLQETVTTIFDTGAAPGAFSISAPSVSSGPACGTPSFAAGFHVTPPSATSGPACGVPTLAFTVPDVGEPVTVQEAKLAARVDGVELDLYIKGVIAAARAQAEQITGRVYRRRHFRFELEGWPKDGYRFPVHEPTDCEITYWAGGWQQLAPGAFEFAPIGSGAEIAPALDTAWPSLGRRAVGALVRVDFTAGPTDVDQVDAAVKLYIKAQVAAWIDNPTAMSSKQVELSPLLDHLLDEQRLWA